MRSNLIAAVSIALALAASSGAQADEPRTEAAVIAADAAWLDAEVHGDAGTLEAILLPEYVSVSVKGVVATRAKLVENARQRGDSKAMADQVAAWRAAHPTRPQVTLQGDTAVLAWMTKTDGGERLTSSDIFVYRSGRWRALYSQHSSAAS